MRYLFITLSICAIWFALILISVTVDDASLELFLTAQLLTLVLFWIGFYKK
jgi:hypothetical protein